jgi:4-aminobutyrate aminotransferase
MQHLREVCDKHNILLICDEVQSGFFRTGTYFNVEQSNVRPDILIMAKGLANGYPLSGIVSRKELMDTVDPGAFGGTYAGNAVACAAGVAAQEVYQMGDIEKNVAARYVFLASSGWT